jgi:hypothetical protein
MPKIQNPNKQPLTPSFWFAFSAIEPWNLFGIWDLKFDACNSYSALRIPGSAF